MSDLFAVSALQTAKAETMEKAKDKGCICPVCGQFAKVYRRTITEPMASLLLKAARKTEPFKPFHITDLIEGGGGDFAKLRYWGLIAELDNDNPAKKTSGKWVITPSGRLFLDGKTTVPRYIFLYDGKFLGFENEEDRVSFAQCLTENFDYQELMRA